MRRYAKARRHVPGVMNKLEAAWAVELDGSGDAWEFERVTLKLAPDTRYTPDFLVIGPAGDVQFHEVKGFMRDDARVKLKVAADRFPWFRFHLVTRTGGAWQVEEIEPT